MKDIGLTAQDLELISSVFRAVPGIQEVVLYGSRAMGNFRHASDIDLAITGLTSNLEAAAVAEELDELPLPYRFDVKALELITHEPLREHIARVGVRLYKRDSV